MPLIFKVAKNSIKMAFAMLAKNSDFLLALKRWSKMMMTFYLVQFFCKRILGKKEFQDSFIFLNGTWYNVSNRMLV